MSCFEVIATSYEALNEVILYEYFSKDLNVSSVDFTEAAGRDQAVAGRMELSKTRLWWLKCLPFESNVHSYEHQTIYNLSGICTPKWKIWPC